MRRLWEAFWAVVWSIVLGLTIFRNFKKYKEEPFFWKIGKSLLDFVSLIVMTVFLPPLVVAMNSAWVSGLVKVKWQRVVVGIVTSIVFGIISMYAMEVMVLIGILSVDEKTGPVQGAIGRWRMVRAGMPLAKAAA